MKVLVLTGAGISAESGIATFRGSDGLWEGHEISEVATPDGFARNPVLVHEFYNQRRRGLLSESIQPNAAHIALAEFEQRHDDEFLLVTQNIDDLHQRAGSQNVLPMHGELLKARCSDTGELFDWRDDLAVDLPHPKDPAKLGRLRPHVVWFGEMPIGMDTIESFARKADVFVAIGTSALVYPAAGIVQSTPESCRRVEINLGRYTSVVSLWRSDPRKSERGSSEVLCSTAKLVWPHAPRSSLRWLSSPTTERWGTLERRQQPAQRMH